MNHSIDRRITKLYEAIENLEEIKKIDLKEFLASRYLPYAAERLLHIIIEILVDLGNYIIRKEGLPSPDTYSDTFRILCNNGILPLEYKDPLEDMARFRNKLVHGYLSVDSRFIFGIIENDLDLVKEITELLIDKISKIEKK